MKSLLLVILILLLSGCATSYGRLSDGREHYQYDVKFNKDTGNFYVPLEWVSEVKEQ